MENNLEWQDVNEQGRVYMFPNGNMTIANVIRVAVSKTTHRLETADGRKFIVPQGWLSVEIITDGDWSF